MSGTPSDGGNLIPMQVKRGGAGDEHGEREGENSSPLSPWTSIPSKVRWLMIAPVIMPRARTAPAHTKRRVRSRIAAINSSTPDPIRPHGSA